MCSEVHSTRPGREFPGAIYSLVNGRSCKSSGRIGMKGARLVLTMSGRAARDRKPRRLDSGMQDIRPCARPRARRLMEGMVGRGTGVSCAYVRVDTPSTQLGRDERRDNISLRDGRNPCRHAAGKGCCEGQGRAHRRRCRHDSAISSRKAHRRTGPCISSHPHGLG